MSRKTGLSVVSWIMNTEQQQNGRNRRRIEQASSNEDPSSSGTEDEDDGGDQRFRFNGRTFYDFESDESLPNITVKTFLRDCIKYPKILFHKKFQFFRGYLRDVGVDLSLPVDSPFTENHDNNTFCVDKNDKKGLSALKRRVESENKDDYWASIIPVKRKSDLGLIVFRWEPYDMSTHFLHVYLKFCESKSDPNNAREYVDAYIKDFKKVFNLQRNFETEVRYKEDQEANETRKTKGIEEPPKITSELSVLLKLPPRRHPTQRTTAATSTATSNGDIKKKRKRSKRRERDGVSSGSSSDDSDDPEYIAPSIKRRRKGVDKEETQTESKSTRLNAAIKHNSFTNNSLKKVSNGVVNSSNYNMNHRTIEKQFSSIIGKFNGQFKTDNVSKPVNFCKICKNWKMFSTKEFSFHLYHCHRPKWRNLTVCTCGIIIAKEFSEFHKKSCTKALKRKM